MSQTKMNSRQYFSCLFSILLFAAAGCNLSSLGGRAAEAVPVVSASHATVSELVQSVVEPPAPEPMRSSPPAANAGDAPSTAQEHVVLRAALSHTAYSQSVPERLLFKVEFVCGDKRPPDRPPLNLALVLDRSGSMAEDMKFSHAVTAARAVIENLTDRDLISLVAFNERVLVLSPAGRAVNKPFLFQRLAEVGPEGTTDLSAGLLEGIAQVNSQSAEGQVKHVLLLTDGKANSGVTDSAAFRKIAEAAHAKGVGLSTLACGTDFDEKLLTDMATAGGGRYTYVKSSEQLPTAFKDELSGLLEVVAQNVRLEIRVKEGGTISKVYGQPWQQGAASRQFPIGNLRAGERGLVMVALTPADFKSGAALEVTAKLTFDATETSERVVRTANARVGFAVPDRGPKIEENEEVILCGATMNALDLAATALQSFDLDRYTKARASFDQWHERVRQYALTHRNQDLLNEAFLLKHFMAELEAIRGPGAPTLLSDTQSKLQKENDYQRYQLLHQPVMQNK